MWDLGNRCVETIASQTSNIKPRYYTSPSLSIFCFFTFLLSRSFYFAENQAENTAQKMFCLLSHIRVKRRVVTSSLAGVFHCVVAVLFPPQNSSIPTPRNQQHRPVSYSMRLFIFFAQGVFLLARRIKAERVINTRNLIARISIE